MHSDTLRETIRCVIDEMSRWKQEKVPREEAVDSIERYAGPNTYIHYSDINKLGINPRSDFKTPLGIYGYVFTPTFLAQLQDDDAAPTFARDRAYVHVFKAIDPETVLDLKSYTAARYQEDVEQLQRHRGVFLKRSGVPLTDRGSPIKFEDVKRQAERTALVKTPGGIIWNFTRLLARQDPRAWTQILSRELAYSGVRDECGGIIHQNEPCQGVFFRAGAIEQVASFDNTAATFNSETGTHAIQRFSDALNRFNRLTRDSSGPEKERMRKKIIDPFVQHPSADVRASAVKDASKAAQRTALTDKNGNVRREALDVLRRDPEVLRSMMNDSSAGIIDDVAQFIYDMSEDLGPEALTMLTTLKEKWLGIDRNVARNIQNMINDLG